MTADDAFERMVEKAARADFAGCAGGFEGLTDRERKAALHAARRTLEHAGVPALVEALADIAETDLSGIADKPSVGDELDETLVGIVRGYQSMALAALGGEQVQGRAELEAELRDLRRIGDRLAPAASLLAEDAIEAERVGEPTTSAADAAAAEARAAVKDWTNARESSSPTPTTPKGAEQ